jgi:predicted transcriptional regulator
MLVLQKENLDVNSICNKLKIEQSAISHNLKKLLICNLIDFKKNGKNRIYFLNKKIALPILRIYEKHIQKHSCNNCKVIN